MNKYFGIIFIAVMFMAAAAALFLLHTPYTLVKIEPIPATPALASTTPPVAPAKIKILVVPGHDLLDSGTVYRGLTEESLTRKLGGDIYALLSADKRFDVSITRDPQTGDYMKAFQDYFDEQKQAIENFKSTLGKDMKIKLKDGDATRDEPITHNTTSTRVSSILYGINMWANDNDIDLALHIHFNNYPRSNMQVAGKYSGYAIYVPEHQYDNASTSLAIAQSLKQSLNTYLRPSTLPIEADTIIESQDLIAVGANNSRTNASILIEYGYIYEPELTNDAVIAQIAEVSYEGIVNHYFK